MENNRERNLKSLLPLLIIPVLIIVVIAFFIRSKSNSQDKYYEIVKTAFTSPEAELFFHTEELVKLLDDHKAGKEDYARHIWVVYMFLLWYREYFVEGGCSVTLEEERARERSSSRN